MTNIPIGNSGYISYTKVDNVCYNSNNGSIKIDSIIFDNLYTQFLDYIINWTSAISIDSSQIRNEAKSLIDLKPETYSFTIDSLSSSASLGPYNITINNGEVFNITKIQSSQYTCGDNGFIFVSISGGNPPYNFNIGPQSITQTNTDIKVTGLGAGIYDISITDSSGCVPTNSTDFFESVRLQRSIFSINNISVLPPARLDEYGYLDISISGAGPFSFSFNGLQHSYNTDILDTTFLSSHDAINNLYNYSFKNYLLPDTYDTIISNSFGCSSQFSITLPNLVPISTTITTTPNAISSFSPPRLVLPIFDTIFIPFNHIQNNTELWQLAQKFIGMGKVELKIKDQIVEYKIIRSFLYPYCIDQNSIEIVRLNNNKDNWYFCFHVGPGINITNNMDLIDSNIALFDKDTNELFTCILGLENKTNISNEHASLLIGSFTLIGSLVDEFYDGSESNIKITTSLPQSNDYDYIIKNIKTSIYYNLHLNGYTTTIYFLDNFNVLSSEIGINDSACSITNEDFQYILNIHDLLLAINDFNNYQSIYIFNNNFANKIGSISTSITGNLTATQNNESVPNSFFIDYFTFNDKSNKLESFYVNNNKISNTLLLDKIDDGYVIIRIKDTNNNQVKFLTINNKSMDYDAHFAETQNFLSSYNPIIKSFFEYGDILVYVSKFYEQASEQNNNGFSPIIDNNAIINNSNASSIPSIKQLPSPSGTGKIYIQTLPTNAKCYLLGPKNYQQQFIGSTVFENLVPGVYNIVGDDDYLSNNFLYPNNTRIVVIKDQTYNINIRFSSYLDKIFIKE